MRMTCAGLIAISLLGTPSAAREITVPAGTRLFLSLDQGVSSKRGESEVGQIIPCRVWRDVVSDGALVIQADTVANCRVDKIRRRNIAGFQGKIALAGVSTTSVDGHQISLQGGYNKEGSSRKAVAWTLGLLIVWPALFVPGGAAELPAGTIFDVSTVNSFVVARNSNVAALPRLDLSTLRAPFSARIMLDEFLAQEKPEVLGIWIDIDGPPPAEFRIGTVNGKTIEALPLTRGGARSAPEAGVAYTVPLKPLAAHFQKGINRFEIFAAGFESSPVEVILDVQM